MAAFSQGVQVTRTPIQRKEGRSFAWAQNEGVDSPEDLPVDSGEPWCQHSLPARLFEQTHEADAASPSLLRHGQALPTHRRSSASRASGMPDGAGAP
jgi:hypothetical protein